VRKADNHTTFMYRLSKNLGASTSWDPKGLSRPVMGLLYIFTVIHKDGAGDVTIKCRFLQSIKQIVIFL
jgi:hypothetical protein